MSAKDVGIGGFPGSLSHLFNAPSAGIPNGQRKRREMEANPSFTVCWCGRHNNWYILLCPDCLVAAKKPDIKRDAQREVINFVTEQVFPLLNMGSVPVSVKDSWNSKLTEWGCEN